MKKLLYLPLLVTNELGIMASEQKYLVKAFQKKFELRIFDFYEFAGNKTNEFNRIIAEFKPDIIHCQFQGTKYIDPFFLAVIKLTYPQIVITQWTGDVRIEPIQEMLEYGKYCDITFVNSIDDVKRYKSAGLLDVRYMQNAMAIPEQVGYPSSKPQGIIFCGGNYETFPGSETRLKLVERFKKEFSGDFQVYGMGWQNPPQLLEWTNQTKIYQNSYMILGHNHIEDLEGWFSDRVFIALASGRPFLCQWSKNLDKYFSDKQMVYWRTVDEAVDKAKWLLKYPKEAEKIGKAGQAKVLKEHHWDIRVKEFIKHWEDYL